MSPLSADALGAAASALPAWTVSADGLRRTFEFDGFTEAFSFMTRVAAIAEALDHHPDWSNVYRRVEICLSTHDAGGVTELDVRMAREIDATLG